MHIIAALGNPGAEYADTRHNAGRVVMEAVRQEWRLPDMVASGRFGGAISEGVAAGEEVLILFPGTYMNESGKAVRRAAGSGAVDRLAVIYDDVDIPLGEFKLSFGRGSGGHNGLRSVIDELGTPDFFRVRVGIAPRSIFGIPRRPRGDRLADYVLGKLTAREAARLRQTAPAVKAALETWLQKGQEAAMTRSN